MLSRSKLFSQLDHCTQRPGTNAHLLAHDMEQKRFDFLNLERRSTLPQNSHFSSSPFGPGGRGTNSRSEACFFSVKKQNMSECSGHYSQKFASHHKESILLIIKLTRCTNFLKFYFGMKLYMFQTPHTPRTRTPTPTHTKARACAFSLSLIFLWVLNYCFYDWKSALVLSCWIKVYLFCHSLQN
jgi:hypothetical protein